jgi:hypothetical protein
MHDLELNFLEKIKIGLDKAMNKFNESLELNPL